MSEHFFLTLPSNSSMGVFPENTLTSYKTHLQDRISLSGEWEVGLVEIHYPTKFLAIASALFALWVEYEKFPTRDLKLAETVYSTEVSSDDVVVPNPNIVQKRIVFRKGNYRTVKELVEVMQQNEDFRQVADIVFETSGSVGVVNNSKVIINLEAGTKRIVLTEALRRILGLPLMDITERVESFRIPNLMNNTPHHMYIYCDIITPQLVGDSLAQLLRIVTIDKAQVDSNDQAVQVFSHPHYVPVMRRDFQHLEIDLRDDLGSPLPFIDGQLNVKLHFRRLR